MTGMEILSWILLLLGGFISLPSTWGLYKALDNLNPAFSVKKYFIGMLAGGAIAMIGLVLMLFNDM